MLAKNISRGKSSLRVSIRPGRNSPQKMARHAPPDFHCFRASRRHMKTPANKDPICGAPLLPDCAPLRALATIAHGQSYLGGLRGSPHDNAGNALSNVTLSLTNGTTKLTGATAPSNSCALTNKTEVCRTPQ
jgi:hypothetical protein